MAVGYYVKPSIQYVERTCRYNDSESLCFVVVWDSNKWVYFQFLALNG